jgi:transposase
MNTEYDVWLGLDVGKIGHHGCGLDLSGERVFDRELPQDEAALRDVITTSQDGHGRVLVIVDQPNTIGALPVAVARDCGADIAYLPGLAMRKAADLYPGQAKTDARDAFVIADTARTMPHTLRTVDRESDVLANLKVLAGTDEDLAHDITRAINRLRSLLLQIHPALERVFKGTVLTRTIVLDLLIRYRGPAGLRAAGKSGVKRWAKNHTRKDPSALIDAIFDALAEQTVTVPGSEASESVVPRHAARIKALKAERKEIEAEAEELADSLPLLQVLTSMPGVGVKTASPTLGVCAGQRLVRPVGALSDRRKADVIRSSVRFRQAAPANSPCPAETQGRGCSVLVVARCAGLTALPDTDVALICDGPLAG